MAQNTWRITVDEDEKQIGCSNPISLYEELAVTIEGCTVAAADLVLKVVDDDRNTILTLSTFTEDSDGNLAGTLELTGATLEAFFTGKPAAFQETFWVVLWDEANDNVVGVGRMLIQNNPYSE
jgi:hypothetical protein